MSKNATNCLRCAIFNLVCLVVPYLGANPILIRNVRQSKLIKKDGVRKLDPQWFWQQDGATCHWAAAEMKLLAKYGLSSELKTVIVDATTGKWPAHSPIMNWMDEYVWGYMATEMRFMRITNKAELRRAITRIWKTKITKEFCQAAIRSFCKGSKRCPWWRNEECVYGGHGVLDQIVRANGDRVKDFRIWPTGDADEA